MASTLLLDPCRFFIKHPIWQPLSWNPSRFHSSPIRIPIFNPSTHFASVYPRSPICAKSTRLWGFDVVGGDEEARDRDSVDGFVGDLPEELLFGCFWWEDGRKLVFFRFGFEIFIVVFIVGIMVGIIVKFVGYSSSAHEPSAHDPSASKPLSSEPLFSESDVKAFFAAVVKTVMIMIALLGLVGWHLSESGKVSVLKLQKQRLLCYGILTIASPRIC
ncbi:hypothetical protein Droror1_Dr00027595, partial [Drosera rotundifolia]